MIKIDVIDKVAIAPDGAYLTCANSCQEIEFSFDEDWDDITDKTARFSYCRDGKEKYKEQDFKGNKVEVPVLYDITEVEVGVYGGALKTSTPAKIPCRRSALCGNRTPEDPTPDIYAKILQELEKVREELKGKVIKSIEVVDNALTVEFTDETSYKSESLKGEKGDVGEQGPKGDQGDSYILTDADKQTIADMVLASLPNGDEVSY